MMCCDSSSQVPALYTLAKDSVVCDNWFSSMPGPTWPNRFFAMGASSGGLDDSPSSTQIAEWEFIDGFSYPHGSIFTLLKAKGLQYRIYSDLEDKFASDPNYSGGEFPVVAALKSISLTEDINSFTHFASDLNSKDGYPYQFTFIEPNYGDIALGTYRGGSSQHPMDTLAAGDNMIAATYSALSKSPIWETSMLIITYDEHGGYYDHMTPPAATPPGDNPPPGLNTHGFNFTQQGVRVPAVIVSPLIPRRTIDHTHYSHASILKTVEEIFNLPPLTNTDKKANSLTHLLLVKDQSPEPPEEVVLPEAPAPAPAPADTADLAARELEPLPEKGNEIGFLHIALKADIEMSGGGDDAKAAALARLQTIKTRGDAKAYMSEVAAKVRAARAARGKQ